MNPGLVPAVPIKNSFKNFGDIISLYIDKVNTAIDTKAGW
jgi:hypothetical protein